MGTSERDYVLRNVGPAVVIVVPDDVVFIKRVPMLDLDDKPDTPGATHDVHRKTYRESLARTERDHSTRSFQRVGDAVLGVGDLVGGAMEKHDDVANPLDVDRLRGPARVRDGPNDRQAGS